MTARCPADSGRPGRLELTGRRHGAELGCCPRATGVHIPSCSGLGWCHRIKKARVGTRRHQIRSTISVARFAIRLPC